MQLKPNEILTTSLNNWQMAVKLLKYPHLAKFLFRYILHPLMFKEETESNQMKRFGFLSLGGGLVPLDELRAYRYAMQAMVEGVQPMLKPKEERPPIVLNLLMTPTEIVPAMGATNLYISMFTKISNILGTKCASLLLEACESNGLNADICSLNKIGYGAMFLKQLPKPDVIVTGDAPCDSMVSCSQLMDYFYDVPSYSQITPYGLDDEAIGMFARSTWEMIGFLEKTLQRKLDWDILKQQAENTNETNRYLRDVTDMHRAIPSPNLMLANITAFGSRVLSPGSATNVKLAREIYNIGIKRSRKNLKKNKKREKIRVLVWDLNVIFTEITKWMEKQFGAVVVGDFLTNVMAPEIDTSSEESMIRGIAAHKLYTGMIRQSLGVFEPALQEIETLIEQFSPDCIIIPGHVACKYYNGVKKIIEDGVNKAGVPTLFMETDVWDIRQNSEQEVKRQIENFFINRGFA